MTLIIANDLVKIVLFKYFQTCRHSLKLVLIKCSDSLAENFSLGITLFYVAYIHMYIFTQRHNTLEKCISLCPIE